jgi:hypothetical protein
MAKGDVLISLVCQRLYDKPDSDAWDEFGFMRFNPGRMAEQIWYTNPAEAERTVNDYLDNSRDWWRSKRSRWLRDQMKYQMEHWVQSETEKRLHRELVEHTGLHEKPPDGLKELRRAMADAHPDRGGTTEKFIAAKRRYEQAAGASNEHSRRYAQR